MAQAPLARLGRPGLSTSPAYVQGVANANAALGPGGPGVANAFQAEPRTGFNAVNPPNFASKHPGAPAGFYEFRVKPASLALAQATGFCQTATAIAGPLRPCAAVPTVILGRAGAVGVAAQAPKEFADEMSKRWIARGNVGSGFQRLARAAGLAFPPGESVEHFLLGVAESSISSATRGLLVEADTRMYLLPTISFQSALVTARAYARAAGAVDPSRAAGAAGAASAAADAVATLTRAGQLARDAVLTSLVEGSPNRWATAYAAQGAAVAASLAQVIADCNRLIQAHGGVAPPTSELPPFASPHIHPAPRSKMPHPSAPPHISADYLSRGIPGFSGGYSVGGEHKLVTLRAALRPGNADVGPGLEEVLASVEGKTCWTQGELTSASHDHVTEAFVTTSIRKLRRRYSLYAFPMRRLLDCELPRFSSASNLEFESRTVVLTSAGGAAPDAYWGHVVQKGTASPPEHQVCDEGADQFQQRMVYEFGGAYLLDWWF